MEYAIVFALAVALGYDLWRSVGVLPGPVETKPAAGRAYMTPEGIKRTDDTPSIVPAAAVLLAMGASIGGSDDSFSGGSDNFSAGGSND